MNESHARGLEQGSEDCPCAPWGAFAVTLSDAAGVNQIGVQEQDSNKS